MSSKFSLSVALVAAGLLAATMSGPAGAIGGAGTLKTLGLEQQSAVEQAHFWHRTCQRGLNGWHKHVPGVGRVQCTNHVCRHGKCFWF